MICQNSEWQTSSLGTIAHVYSQSIAAMNM